MPNTAPVSEAAGAAPAQARQAIREGRFGEALRELENAHRARPEERETAELLVGALHRIAVGRFVVGRYLAAMGLAESDYRGFSADPHLPDLAAALDRLGTLADSLRAGPLADAADAAEVFLLDHDQASAGDSSARSRARERAAGAGASFLLAREAFAQGRYDAAHLHLQDFALRGGPCGPSHRLMARTLLKAGDARAALPYFNSALIYADEPWFARKPRLFLMGRYRGYRILLREGVFYAVPEHRPLLLREGENEVLEPRLPSAVRALIRRLVPPGPLDAVRRAVYATRLGRALLRPADFAADIRNADMANVMREIDRRAGAGSARTAA
jgi:tetratricopeptide (TPR) repeat protein